MCWNTPVDGCPVDCRTQAECEDGNACTNDSCEPGGICQNTPREGICDDGSTCTIFDHCEDGECVPNSELDCDDEDDCTEDWCDAVLGCRHDPICGQIPCDNDGDCDDGDPCTTDACDVSTHFCLILETTGICDDGNPCTVNERCIEGLCSGGLATPCDDGQPCTIDMCDPATGCYAEVDPYCSEVGCTDGSDCNDGNDCTLDSCNAYDGSCHNRPQPGCGLSCERDEDCEDLEDCTFNVCDLATNTCTYPLDPHCGAARCLTHADCDDDDECTYDFCEADGYCVNPPIATCGDDCVEDSQCDDADPCTEDICDANNQCVVVAIPDCRMCVSPDECNDNNECTDDICDGGACRNTPHNRTCSDGDNCTTPDMCVDGECVGAPRDCDDGDACTLDVCDADQGCLHHFDQTREGCTACQDSAECEDDDPCTEDFCNSLQCVNDVLSYCTEKPCTNEFDCDDDDPCTIDQCDQETREACFNIPQAGCVSSTPCDTDAECEDASPCTDTSCTDGFCTALIVPPCAMFCTTDEDCDDGAPCTTDTCGGEGVGCLYEADDSCEPCLEDLDCDDANDCTVEACAATGVCGVTSRDAGSACNPGENVCYEGGLCEAEGQCVPQLVRCPEDGDRCTINECNPDAAPGSECDPQPDLEDPYCNCAQNGDCDDEDPCTVDRCFPGYVCQNLTYPDLLCTSADCTTGAGCDDGLGWTHDVCHAETDVCLHLVDPLAAGIPDCDGDIANCIDGDGCTTDRCADGACTWEITEYHPLHPEEYRCEPFPACAADADCVAGRWECVIDEETQDCTFVGEPCDTGLCTDIGCTYLRTPSCEGTPCADHGDCPDSASMDGVCPAGGGTCFTLGVAP